MGRSGRRRVQCEFSIERMANEIYQCYDEIVCGPRHEFEELAVEPELKGVEN